MYPILFGLAALYSRPPLLFDGKLQLSQDDVQIYPYKPYISFHAYNFSIKGSCFVKFSNNSSFGGAICIDNERAHICVLSSTFFLCSAQFGGALYFSGNAYISDRITGKECDLTDQAGRGVFIFISRLANSNVITMNLTTVLMCPAETKKIGASPIAVIEGKMGIYSMNSSYNCVSSLCGCIYTSHTSNINIRCSSFCFSSASTDPSILHVNYYENAMIYICSFIGNQMKFQESGCIIRSNAGDKLLIDQCIFSNNSSNYILHIMNCNSTYLTDCFIFHDGKINNTEINITGAHYTCTEAYIIENGNNFQCMQTSVHIILTPTNQYDGLSTAKISAIVVSCVLFVSAVSLISWKIYMKIKKDADRIRSLELTQLIDREFG